MVYDPQKHADVFMTVSADSDPHPITDSLNPRLKAPVMTQPPFASEYAEEAARATVQPRSEIFCLLMLLEPEFWMKGLWGDEKGGWRDARTGEFFSFDDARNLISARISELGLNADLVHAYPHSHSSMAESQAFHRLPFDQQMNRFTKQGEGK